MKTIIIVLAALMMASTVQARVITGTYTYGKNGTGVKKVWDARLKAYRVTTYPVLKLKYNTSTNRGLVSSLNGMCSDESITLRFLDADGLMIGSFDVDVGYYFYDKDMYQYQSYEQSKYRSQISRIEVLADCLDAVDEKVICKDKNRIYNPLSDKCELDCGYRQYYDYEKDKCFNIDDISYVNEKKEVMDDGISYVNEKYVMDADGSICEPSILHDGRCNAETVQDTTQETTKQSIVTAQIPLDSIVTDSYGISCEFAHMLGGICQ